MWEQIAPEYRVRYDHEEQMRMYKSILNESHRRELEKFTGHLHPDNPMYGVSIINNGLWNTNTDDEYKFESEGGILNAMIKHIELQDELAEINRRQIVFETGLEGRRLFDGALREEINRQLDTEAMLNYIVGIDPALDSEENQRLNTAQTVISRSRRTGHSTSIDAMRRHNEMLWSEIRNLNILPDWISTTREFETEEEAIEYLDSLSQNTTENE